MSTRTFGRHTAASFALVYLTTYPPLFVASHFSGAFQRVAHAVVPWVGKHLLRLPYDIVVFEHRGGNTTYAYVEMLCHAALAAADEVPLL